MGYIADLIQSFVELWVGGMEEAGYFGIFLLMTVESSFIPFPSEIVMIPAGVLAAAGKLNLWGCVAAGLVGSLAGALINYYLAVFLGRAFLLRYGKYFFIPEDKILWVESSWSKHGEVATFVCRLLPAIRQLISIPAGLARMNILRFSLFTSLGAGLWVVILTLTGYFLGPQAEVLWHEHKTMITGGLFAAVALIVVAYLIRHRVQSRLPPAAMDAPSH